MRTVKEVTDFGKTLWLVRLSDNAMWFMSKREKPDQLAAYLTAVKELEEQQEQTNDTGTQT